jgi:hypothetical protein
VNTPTTNGAISLRTICPAWTSSAVICIFYQRGPSLSVCHARLTGDNITAAKSPLANKHTRCWEMTVAQLGDKGPDPAVDGNRL